MKSTIGLLLLCLLLTGCLKREETITVEPDGSVAIEVATATDNRDELEPGRTPVAAAGWAVREKVEQRNNKTEYHVIATQRFAPGAELPQRDGDPADPNYAHYVAFPTTVTREQRPEGTVYHFRRVYRARPWLFVAGVEKRDGAEDVEKTLQQEPAQITAEQWEQVVRFNAQTEALKKLALARPAALRMNPPLPQDQWLRIHQAVIDAAQAVDAPGLVALLQAPESEQQKQALLAATQQVEQQIAAALTQALAQLPAAQREAFDRLHAQTLAEHQITADQTGQIYGITVKLPGKLLGSNASKLENGACVWEFTGQMLCDREVELLASSLVPNQP